MSVVGGPVEGVDVPLVRGGADGPGFLGHDGVIGELSTQASATDNAAGTAKGATGGRNAAFKALEAWMKKFRGIAKVALKQRPDLRAVLKL